MSKPATSTKSRAMSRISVSKSTPAHGKVSFRGSPTIPSKSSFKSLSPETTEVTTAFQKFYYVRNGVNEKLVMNNESNFKKQDDLRKEGNGSRRWRRRYLEEDFVGFQINEI